MAAAAMAVALSMATVTTGVLPNTEVHVHAEELDRTWTKLADSSVDGFIIGKISMEISSV